MKKTSITKALLLAGVLAAAGAANADAIFYPDGTHVDLGANAVASGLADRVLAMSPHTAPSGTMLASLGVAPDMNVALNGTDTTVLGAGPLMLVPSTSVTVVTMPSPTPGSPACNVAMNDSHASCSYLPD